MSFVIRCGTPDCDLQEWDTAPHVHLDLENWMLTLIDL